MTLAHNYPIYALIDDGTNPIVGASIYVEDQTTGQGIATATTDASGVFVLDISAYVSDGDTIKVWGFYNGNYGSTSFVLDDSGPAEETNFSIVPLTFSDTMTIADSPSHAATYNRSLSDTFNITDSSSIAAGYLRSASDTLNITDSSSEVATYARSASDTLNITDSYSYAQVTQQVLDYLKLSSDNEGIYKISSDNEQTYKIKKI